MLTCRLYRWYDLNRFSFTVRAFRRSGHIKQNSTDQSLDTDGYVCTDNVALAQVEAVSQSVSALPAYT